jgi:hypothetical protein
MKFGRNLLPYAVVFDAEAGVSTFIDRLFRPIICVPGKWPRAKMELATVADGPPLYGAKLFYQFFGEHAQPTADPIVRRRLRSLIDGCSVLKAELRRRSDAMTRDDAPPARSHADLIRHTFADAAA